MDALSIVADEVALEGLDGVTLPTLWIRLENREPKFPLKLDEGTKGFIWRSLAGNTDLRFYELPSAREDVVLVDRFKNVDHETGINVTLDLPDPVRDIYPICAVTENKDGIQGSCALFKQRTDVTKHVRSKSLAVLLTLEEARERYGRKLVIVASQMTRFRALIGSESDPDLKLGNDSYCVLEKVGRARWQGELQRDLHGSTFKVDARKFHYLRKSLVRHQLVTMQSYGKRLPSGHQQHSILLLLKRFHVNRRTKYDVLMEFVSNLLQQSPNQLNTVMLIKDQVNVDEGTFRRLLKYMRVAKLVEFFQYPLEELDPSAGPCTNKNGSKVMVRCCRLIKPYMKKGVTEDEDDDEEDEEVDRTRGLPSQGRIMEMDLLSQAYHIVLSCGTKGVPQREIGLQLNVGKLEARMVCRKLEGDGWIKGFMEDEGRQRTTKFISHRCVGLSDRLQLVAKERERNKQLKSSAPEMAAEQENGQTPSAAKKKRGRVRKKKNEGEEEAGGGGDSKVDEGMKGKGRDAEGGGTEEPGEVVTTDPGALVVQLPAAECEAASCSESVTPDPGLASAPSPAAAAEEQPSTSAQPLPQTEGSGTARRRSNNNHNVVCQLEAPDYMERSHETYRLLRRKNLILEAVNNFKIIEGLFPLQKIINEEEKQDGLSSKCCKKTILRLVHGLSRQGLLKIYTTTVIQDGITKKVDMIVHPSIQPTDDVVNQLIEQVRLKISSSYAAVRQQHAEERARELEKELEESSPAKETKGKAERRRALFVDDDFKPTPVRGLSRTLGFQPKMHRLRAIHTFLWYLIYGRQPQQKTSDAQEATDGETSASTATPRPKDAGAADQEAADGGASNLDVMDEDEEEPKESMLCQSKSSLKVYVNEASWKRFIPPLRQHKDCSQGWAIVGDLLLCLPLSVYVQIIQVNYKVDGLEEYLSDPVKQHYLIRALPISMKRQLLYKRRYIFVFYENLQKLAYMGLLHFGPVEKFKEKEQTYVYLKRNTTIVDTTNAEPHYWLVNESPDKPFERRHYTLNTAEDVENFWFDLMCVCLNTPLGVIRGQRRSAEHDLAPAFVPDRHVFVGLAYLLKGSLEVCDDGSIPGDGKGAAGLDSEFFGHLKRNWLWTSHLLSVKGSPTGSEAQDTKIRLKSLVSRNVLRIALKGGFTKPRYMTTKRPLVPEYVELGVEPASRNQQVMGGRKMKRKRTRKDPVKSPRKKKRGCEEPKKRTPAHDEADHKALKMMTRQRVYWSVQEDSLMMLCCVAAHLLNSQLKRPFVPHCMVRDLLHSEFEVSLDKTSVAVGRRCHYILKNPQTLLNYRICLAEVYQDKAMMKTLVGNKPADPDNPEDCAKAFSEYIRLLRQKFTSIISTSDSIIPDSKQELFARFKVSAIDAGKNVASNDVLTCTADIHAIVLFNLIQSTLAMSNSQMKSSRSFQTFHMYNKYDQELLCQVFIECRKRGLVNRRRVNQPFGPKKNRALPILPMSYQLSQSYYRCFSWRFPLSLCTDSFCFLRTLINNGTGDVRPITTFHHETESRSVSGEDAPEKSVSSKRKEKQKEAREGGEQASSDSSKDKDEVGGEERPTEEAVTDGNSDETSRAQKSKEREGERTSGSPDAPSSKDPAGESLTASPAAARQAAAKSPDVSDMLHVSLETVGGACVVSLSLMSLGLLSVHMSIPKQVVVVDTNLVDSDVVKSMMLDEDDDDEDDGDECEGKKKMQVKAHQASHTKFLMMRGYCLPGIVKLRNLNTCDNIVVESCRMRLQLRDTPAHRLFSEEDLPPLDLAKCGPSLLPQILTYSFPSPSSSAPAADEWERTGYTRQDVEACARLRRDLNQAGPTGLDAQDLHQAHPDLWETQAGRTRSLQQYLQDLEEDGWALRVGGLAPRWVLKQHADPWLLTVNNKQWHQTRLTPDRISHLNKQHKMPFMRKRSSRQRAHETEGPPAKKPDVGGESEAEAKTASEDDRSEQQTEKTDQEGGEEEEEEEEEEGGKQTQPEEGPEKEETKTTQEEKTRQEDRQDREDIEDGHDEGKHGGPRSPPAGPADHDSVSFISRPWRMVDGKLNRHVCKGMLEAVLYHVMSRPGITQQALVAHYQDLLQPVAVLDLVQALIDLGCVTKKTMVRGPKPSLFTRSAPHQGSETRAQIEDPEAVFYEPTLSCCLRLCQVLPNERHWNSITTQ